MLSVKDAYRLRADRPIAQSIDIAKATEILHAVFNEILPKRGLNFKAEQISLAEHILETICRRNIMLAKSEIGTGKTLAYLVPAIIAKRGRINDFWNSTIYNMQCTEMPIVIATSSIALQRVILTEYIPALSNILVENGVITEPLTAVIRKGKAHYICERRLRERLLSEVNHDEKQAMENLLLPNAEIDLEEIDTLTPYVKNKICVSGRCLETCAHKETCGYLAFRNESGPAEIDIQVCNHNYLLADTISRAENRTSLIPNYQTLIIEDAHKFVSAARSMYCIELPGKYAVEILDTIDRLTFKREGNYRLARRYGTKLYDENVKLFKKLSLTIPNDTDEDTDRNGAEMTCETIRCLRNMHNISEQLFIILRDEAFFVKSTELLKWVQQKYHTDTSRVDLKKLLLSTNEVETRENQGELMSFQLISLHKTICNLPELRDRESREFASRGMKYSYASVERESSVSETIWKRVRRILPAESSFGCRNEWLTGLMRDVQKFGDCVDSFLKHTELICWIDSSGSVKKLCAIQKDLGAKLFSDLWSKGISTILMSSALSSNEDFVEIKRTLGLDRLSNRVTETSKLSPFLHCENAPLYRNMR